MPEITCYEKPEDDDVAVEMNMVTLTWESADDEDCGIFTVM